MSTAFVRIGEIEFAQTLARLRNQAAVVRALLDELDRVAPVARGEPRSHELAVLGARLAEEFGRLGCQILECAASMAGEEAPSR